MNFILAFLIFTLSFVGITFAESPEEKGLAIAQEDDNRDNGFKNFTANMVMTLKNRQGEESTRNIRNKTLEVKDDGDKSLSIFDRPRDVKGTTLLNYTHKVGTDDQWLYLPGLKRVKRISSANKPGSFMGSEFSYEDLGSQEIEKYKYKWLKNSKTKKGDTVWVLERIPRKKSGYSKQVLYIKAKIHNPIKIEYYDKKKELLKKSTFKKYRGYKIGKKTIYRPTTIHMVNVKTNNNSCNNGSI